MEKSKKFHIPTDSLGPPGLPGYLSFTPIDENSKLTNEEQLKADEERLMDQSNRKFQLKARLGKYTARDYGITEGLDNESGDSYFLAQKNAAVNELHTPSGILHMSYNSSHELSLIEFSCTARNSAEATSIFLLELARYLDHMSYLVNIPVHITQVSCFDEVHGIHSIQYTSPHQHVSLGSHGGFIYTELFPIYALYREAKNNESPFYKFLCYYKILEGVYKHLRGAVFKRAKEKQIVLTKRKEPAPKLDAVFTQVEQVEGKSITELFNNRFTPIFRNKVAHYLLDESPPLNVSDITTSSEFGAELALIEACVKVVVRNQEEYISEYNKKLGK